MRVGEGGFSHIDANQVSPSEHLSLLTAEDLQDPLVRGGIIAVSHDPKVSASYRESAKRLIGEDVSPEDLRHRAMLERTRLDRD